jgi:hypothetical protein
MSRVMSREFVLSGSICVAYRVALSAVARSQVHSRHHRNRTENPRVGGSIPSLATVWGDNLRDFELPGAKACRGTCFRIWWLFAVVLELRKIVLRTHHSPATRSVTSVLRDIPQLHTPSASLASFSIEIVARFSIKFRAKLHRKIASGEAKK